MSLTHSIYSQLWSTGGDFITLNKGYRFQRQLSSHQKN